MRNLGYYNGEIGLIEDMKVPMTDRGLYFGDGIYDAAYTRNHVIYALDEHVSRLKLRSRTATRQRHPASSLLTPLTAAR